MCSSFESFHVRWLYKLQQTLHAHDDAPLTGRYRASGGANNAGGGAGSALFRMSNFATTWAGRLLPLGQIKRERSTESSFRAGAADSWLPILPAKRQHAAVSSPDGTEDGTDDSAEPAVAAAARTAAAALPAEHAQMGLDLDEGRASPSLADVAAADIVTYAHTAPAQPVTHSLEQPVVSNLLEGDSAFATPVGSQSKQPATQQPQLASPPASPREPAQQLLQPSLPHPTQEQRTPSPNQAPNQPETSAAGRLQPFAKPLSLQQPSRQSASSPSKPAAAPPTAASSPPATQRPSEPPALAASPARRLVPLSDVPRPPPGSPVPPADASLRAGTAPHSASGLALTAAPSPAAPRSAPAAAAASASGTAAVAAPQPVLGGPPAWPASEAHRPAPRPAPECAASPPRPAGRMPAQAAPPHPQPDPAPRPTGVPMRLEDGSLTAARNAMPRQGGEYAYTALKWVSVHMACARGHIS